MTAPRTITLTLPTDVAQHVYELAHEFACTESYGHFMGGDPRDFQPDPECSTEAERAQHKADCEAWERGEQVPVDGAYSESKTTDESGRTVYLSGHHAVYGLGGMTIRDPLLKAFCVEMERAAAELKAVKP